MSSSRSPYGEIKFVTEAEAKRRAEAYQREVANPGYFGNNQFIQNVANFRPKKNSKLAQLKEAGGKVVSVFNIVGKAIDLITGPSLGGGTYTSYDEDRNITTPHFRQPKSITSVVNNHYSFSGPGKNYYDQTIVYVPIYPPRKLRPKLDAIDTIDSKDTRQPVITAEQSFSSKKWGQLLHQPVSSGKLKIVEWDSNDFLRRLSSNRIKAEEKFNDWLLNGTESEVHEQSVVFIDNYDFDSQSKKLTQFSGINSIQALYDLYYAKSQIQFNGIIDTIPKEVEIKKQKIQRANYKQDLFYCQNTRGGAATRAIGADAFPMLLPSILTGEDKGVETIYTMAELILFTLKMQDNLQGQFPIEIEIEDTNLKQGGNQSKKVTLYNISECLAEVYGMGVNTQIHQQLLMNLATTNLAHTTQAIISSNVTQDYVKGNADFLGWERKDVKRKMDLPYKIGAESFSELLNHSKAEYVSIDNTDDKDANDYLVSLLEAAAIIKGSLFKKMPTDKDGIKKYLLDKLKDINPGGKTDDEKWEEYLEKVEVGFSTESGVNNKTPYNRTYSERPKLRDTTSGN